MKISSLFASASMYQIIIIFLWILFVSCKRESKTNSTIFKGIVFDFSTNQRLADTKVSIAFTNNSIPDTTYSGPAFTNSNGEYKIEMKVPAGYKAYFVETKKDNYTAIENICKPKIFGRALTAGQYLYSDTSFIDKYTIVNLNISNLPPASLSDTLSLWFTHGNQNCISTPPFYIGDYLSIERNLTGFINNFVVSDTFSFKEAPSVKVSWVLKNGGQIGSGSQQFNVTEFSNTIHQINY